VPQTEEPEDVIEVPLLKSETGIGPITRSFPERVGQTARLPTEGHACWMSTSRIGYLRRDVSKACAKDLQQLGRETRLVPSASAYLFSTKKLQGRHF
jgi:hypothetical protein